MASCQRRSDGRDSDTVRPERRLEAGRRPAIGSSSRAITPAIPTTRSSGGTTPAICDQRTGAASGIKSRSSALASIAAPVNPSRWAVRDLFMTHLAVSDPQCGSDGYRFEERLNRGGPGIAGAETTTVSRVERRLASGPRRRRAARDSRALGRRQRRRSRPRSRQAARHQRRRRHQPEGRAGRQRLALLLDDADADARTAESSTATAVDVSGESWMDHEFGTSFLEAEQQGWDWLSIQLDDQSRADALSAAARRRLARSAVERHARRRCRPHHASRRRRISL